MKLCRYLRWKTYYGAHFPTEADLQAYFELNDCQYQCNRTLQPWGPDDAPSVPEDCQPGRGCFVLSKKSPRTTT
ncbi:MAG: hypothetical protein H6737_17235 [Alphaproteobacteria bacterium]|nr:hypothetical protein [Alphaproteobacteria bacterium]